MGWNFKELVAKGSLCLLLVVGTIAFAPPTHAAPGNIQAPFDNGETWCIYQGYNSGATHHNAQIYPSAYGLDLTGSDCSGTSATGKTVRSPVSGTIQGNPSTSTFGSICINMADGRSLTTTHVNTSLTGGTVTAGQVLGTVAAPHDKNNNGIAHIHLQMWTSQGCWGTGNGGIPFDSAHNAQICGVKDLTASGPNGRNNGIWSGTRIAGDVCGGGGGGGTPPPPVDSDYDGTPDITDILPTIVGTSANRGAPIHSSNLSGDFNGDGYQDIGTFYNYGAGNTTLYVFYGTGGGHFASPVAAWNSGAGNWEWDNTKLVSGDFNNDGKTDIVALYDYGNSNLAMFMFKGQANNTFTAPTQEWASGAGNMEWRRVMPVAGDFNGDGKQDVSLFYDYNVGGGTYGSTGIFSFNGDGAGHFAAPYSAWGSGAGNWEWENTKPVVGDFNSDGKSDIAAFYDYGNETTGLFMFNGSSSGNFSSPVSKWNSGAGNWGWQRIAAFAGDNNGDGKTDISLFYKYAVAGLTKLFTFNGDGAGNIATPTVGWDSGAGNFEWDNTKPVAGDFTNDGKTDVATLYNYGGGSTAIFTFRSSTGGAFATPTSEWGSGAGNWEWPNTLTP